MIASVADLENIIPPKLRYVKSSGQGGLEIIHGNGGMWIQHRSSAGNVVNFTGEHHKWFREVLVKHLPPQVLGQLFGFTEQLRLRQGFLAHQSAAMRNVLMANTGGVESLDHARPLAANLQISSIAADKLPRAYTFVQDKPAPARRYIYFREFSFKAIAGGEIRPDEIVVTYPVTATETALVREGKKFREIVSQPEVARVKELRIHSGDINRPISGDSLVAHFAKTMDGAVAALEYLKLTLGLRPEGIVDVSVKDTYMEAQKLHIKGGRAAIVRHAPSEPSRKLSISMRAKLEPQPDGGYRAAAMDVNLRRLAGSVAEGEILERIKSVVMRLEAVLAQVAKMKK